jgi:hypothetical protein
MPRRSTIARDPFANMPDATAVDSIEADIGVIDKPEIFSRPGDRAAEAGSNVSPGANAKTACAVGGRLEILGGDLGTGSEVVWRYGRSGRIGFIAPTGRFVDLAVELEAVLAWSDRADHPVLSAIGWAWVLGSMAGVFGLAAGGGLRLLFPRRMIVKLRLRDGSDFVARTDRLTVTALEAMVGAR